jgi:peroxiredoxin
MFGGAGRAASGARLGVGARRLYVEARDHARSCSHAIQVGDQLPQATFMVMGGGGPQPMTGEQLFKGKTVALFAVPAPSPPPARPSTCRLQGEGRRNVRAKGVDAKPAISVNDVFVMGRGQGPGRWRGVILLADGNGDFTRAVGLELDGSKFGMGLRSQRYSC